MFESCQNGSDSGGNSSGPRCADVAEKLAQLFGWRQTYKVEKLQRSLAESVGRKVQFAVPPPVPPKQHKRRSSDSWVVVHNLQSQSDGGILDPDDRLNDVADDREQIIANFEDGDGVHHGGGDGASGSSVGTNSPDMFQGENHSQYPGLSRTDIEVTGQQLGSGLLQVRRGSEPALNQLIPTTGNNASTGGGNTGVAVLNTTPDPSKRWSATPIIVDDADEGRERRIPHRKESTCGTRLVNGRLSAEWCQEQDEEEKSAFSRFVRDGSNRLSMQFLGESAGGLRWADAAERVNAIGRGQSKSLPRDHRRKEPLGQATSNSPVPQSTSAHESDLDEELASNSVEYVVLHNESGPLGIHVVPDYDRHGKDRGLLVQGIEPGGRIDRDGRLAVFDRIIEINGKNLLNMPFQRVQEIFKGSLLSPELRLRVIKHRNTSSGTSTAGELLKKPPAPVFPRSISRTLDEPVAMVEGEERLVSMSTKVATVSPTKKVSPAHPATRATSSLLTANTRKIGKKIELELTKGPHGLGFSITTRDNPAGGNCPIYIKNILPKGAAVEDGRLKPGDRLLEVNGVEMTGKTQSEAVTVLRNAPPGSKVRIVVSRQEDSGASSPRLPRQIVPQDSSSVTPTVSSTDVARDGSTGTRTTTREPPEKVNDDALVYPWKHKEIFTFDIPVHDTEKAGLGVSVKGKTSASHGVQSPSNGSSAVDLGIFVKSVLHGGAASRDGRLRTNDQLLNVNGISLLGQSNSDAMETLRRAMLHTEGPIPGVITLTIARRGGSPGPPGLSNGHQHHQSGRESVSSLLTSSSGTETFGGKSEGEGYTPDNSGASENSDNTVIFLPYSHKEEESPDVSTKPSGKMNDAKNMGNLETVSARNPVIDRLMGQITNPHALRNESYYRATNETWNTTMLLSGTTGDKLCSPTVNQPSGEMVLIEEEYGPHQVSHKHRVGKPVLDKASSSKRCDAEPDGQPGTRIPSDQSSEAHGADITYASQLSLEETAAGFSRDAFGRQSMSEKRHATLDAKHTDTYQRNKKLREERERQRHMQFQQQQLNDLKRAEMTAAEAKANRELMVRANSIESLVSLTRSQADSEKSDIRCRNEFGPSLGMKKSSSLESLQTMVQEIQMQEDSDPAYTYRNAQGVVRVIRGRGCNESFRAAVDRSYDAPLAELRNRIEMETLAEEDGVTGNPPDHVAPSGTMTDARAFGGVRGGPRQSSLNSALDGKHKASKKKQGLLRGIGSMFRFGKHRKTLDVPMSLDLRSEDEMGNGPGFEEEQDGEREAARKAAQEEQQRIQEQYRRLMQRQRQMESNSQNTNNAPHEHGSSAGSSDGGSPAGIHHREGSTSSSSLAGMPPTQSRTERIHQLRAQHQRRHAERRGQYPMDDREERYEEVIRQRLEQPETSHGRAASYDLYGEMARPGSRVGITDPAKFSHYVNYEEIQQHLNKRKEHLSEIQIMQMRLQVQRQRYKVEEESRRQQHYHSQRRDNRESHRPVSNFYEYESVQTVMRTSQQQRPGPALAMDSNSNSLPRRGQQDRTIVGKSSNNSNCSNNNSGGSSYTQQQQRLFQSSCTSGNGPSYQPSTRTGSKNANNVNHLRAGHTHDVAHSNHSSALPLVHNVPQGSRNIGLGTKVNNLTGRTQGPFVTQVMISQQPHPQTPGSKV